MGKEGKGVIEVKYNAVGRAENRPGYYIKRKGCFGKMEKEPGTDRRFV